MAQIQKGDTFTNGQQVDATRLNQLVDSSVLLVGAITEQSAMTPNTIESTDQILVNDSGVLKKVDVGDILKVNIPVFTSSITGSTGVDITITPSAGQKVDIVGNAEVDDLNVTNDATIAGDISVTGISAFSGDVTADNAFTSNGVANFTGTLQINGSVAYALIDVIEETVPNATGAASNTLHNLFTSASYTKPAGELWIVELSSNIYSYNDGTAHWRITDSTDTITYTASYWNNVTNGSMPLLEKFYLNSANEHTGTFVLRGKSPVPNLVLNGTAAQLSVFPDASKRIDGKFRIFKYKTA
jgi:hypothetical protein